MSCEFAHLDGSYVLGALSPQERHDYERHLPGCGECTRAVSELAALPGLLAKVELADQEQQGGASPLPSTLLPSLVRVVRRTNRRRVAVTAVAAAACGAALAVGALSVGRASDGDRAPAAAQTSASASAAPAGRVMTSAGDGPVTADVALTSVAWGTRLDLTCTYAPAAAGGYTGRAGADGAAPQAYALIVRTLDGAVQQVGTWHPLPGRTMRLAAATATSEDDIAAVEVRAPDGAVVVTLAG